MAVKIPTYESRLTPDGFQPANGQLAQSVDFVGAATKNLKDAASDLSTSILKIDTVARQKAEESAQADQLLTAQKTLLDNKQQFESWLIEKRNDSDFVNDPNYANNVLTEWNKYSTKAMEGNTWDPKIRRQIEGQYLQVGDSLFSSELTYGAKERVNTRLNQIADISDYYQKFLIGQPENYDETMQGMDTVIDNAALSNEMKLKLKRDVRQRTAMTTFEAIKEKDPEMAKKILESTYRTTSQQDQFADLQVDPRSLDPEDFGPRPDGTKKGTGWLGVLRRPDGGVSTEISIGLEINGKETTVPLLVPTLDRKEVDKILAIPVDDPKFFEKVPKSALDKAEKFAKARIADGLSPFVGPSDSPNAQPTAATTVTDKGDFNSAVAMVLKTEGGYNADDGNGYPVNFGINGKSHPGVDIKNLTKEQATQIYKKEYWDKIGADNLPADVATMAFDAAVNQGVGYAKKLIEKSGGDVAKMAELRRADYRALAERSPSKAKYLDGWLKRVDATEQEATSVASTAAYNPDGTGPTMAPTVGVTPRAEASMPAWATGILKDIDADKIPSLMNQVDAEMERKLAQHKADLMYKVGNQMAMAKDGVMPTDVISEDEFKFVFKQNPEQGALEYENYKKALTLGQDMKAVSTMTRQQQQDLLNKYKPDPTRTDNYKAAQERYEGLQIAVQRVNDDRFKDPMAFAIRYGIGSAKDLKENTPINEITDELTKRVATVKALRDSYGLPAQIFTETEAKSMNARFQTLDVDSQKLWLKTFSTALKNPQDYYAALQQIAPDHPLIARAGEVMISPYPLKMRGGIYTPEKVSNYILQGDRLLNKMASDTKKDGKAVGMPMPKEADMQREFNDRVGTAFAGNLDARNLAYNTFKAIYAGMAQEASDYKGDESNQKNSRIKSALDAALGDVTEVGGVKIIPPWGMSASVFRDELKKEFDKLITANKLSGGYFDQFDTMQFRAFSNGQSFDDQYTITVGNNLLRDKSGMPFLLTVKQPSKAPAVPDQNFYSNQMNSMRDTLTDMGMTPPVNTKQPIDQNRTPKIK